MSDPLQISTLREEDVLVAHAQGRMEGMDRSVELLDSVESALREDDKHIVIDFDGLSYMSSAGLRSIAVLLKHGSQHNHSVVACGLSKKIDALFTVSGFKRLIQIFENRAEAIHAVRNSA